MFFFFGEKLWKNIFQLFSKSLSQIFFDFGKKRPISRGFSKLKRKKKSQNRKSGQPDA